MGGAQGKLLSGGCAPRPALDLCSDALPTPSAQAAGPASCAGSSCCLERSHEGGCGAAGVLARRARRCAPPSATAPRPPPSSRTRAVSANPTPSAQAAAPPPSLQRACGQPESNYLEKELNNFFKLKKFDARCLRVSSMLRLVYTNNQVKNRYQRDFFEKKKNTKISKFRNYLFSKNIYYPSSGIIFIGNFETNVL